ncbi:TetR/AcrR family transcriptional regulator [Polaromonas sp.]|uniref:TetR/AcrR family transcriptional regulator n=1 Tax=Polaromonas sp. TaxID=1869339 RepID=UPI003753C08E
MGRPREFNTDDVLDRAVDVFWARGFDAVGVQEICRATGLNPGSLYSAFGDKRGIFVQALQRYMRVVSHEAIGRLNGNPSGLASLEDYFAKLIDAMVDGKRQWGCLVTNSVVEFALRDAEIAEAFRLHLTRLEVAFEGAVERAKRAGDAHPALSVGETATFLVCTVQGLNVLAKTRPERRVLQAVVATALGTLAGSAAGGALH